MSDGNTSLPVRLATLGAAEYAPFPSRDADSRLGAREVAVTFLGWRVIVPFWYAPLP